MLSQELVDLAKWSQPVAVASSSIPLRTSNNALALQPDPSGFGLSKAKQPSLRFLVSNYLFTGSGATEPGAVRITFWHTPAAFVSIVRPCLIFSV